MDLIIFIIFLLVVGIAFYKYEIPLYKKNLELLELKLEFYRFLLDHKCENCSLLNEDNWKDWL